MDVLDSKALAWAWGLISAAPTEDPNSLKEVGSSETVIEGDDGPIVATDVLIRMSRALEERMAQSEVMGDFMFASLDPQTMLLRALYFAEVAMIPEIGVHVARGHSVSFRKGGIAVWSDKRLRAA